MRSGDPNGEGLAEWKPSTEEQLAYMDLAEKDTLGCVTDIDSLGELMIEYCQVTFGF